VSIAAFQWARKFVFTSFPVGNIVPLKSKVVFPTREFYEHPNFGSSDLEIRVGKYDLRAQWNAANDAPTTLKGFAPWPPDQVRAGLENGFEKPRLLKVFVLKSPPTGRGIMGSEIPRPHTLCIPSYILGGCLTCPPHLNPKLGFRPIRCPPKESRCPYVLTIVLRSDLRNILRKDLSQDHKSMLRQSYDNNINHTISQVENLRQTCEWSPIWYPIQSNIRLIKKLTERNLTIKNDEC